MHWSKNSPSLYCTSNLGLRASAGVSSAGIPFPHSLFSCFLYSTKPYPELYTYGWMTIPSSYRILVMTGENPDHIWKSKKGKGTQPWHASLFFRAHTFSICPFCSSAARSFWRARILRLNNGAYELLLKVHGSLQGRLSGELRAGGLFVCFLPCSRIPTKRGSRLKLSTVRVRLSSPVLNTCPGAWKWLYRHG